MLSKNETRAKRLRNLLSEHDLQLDHAVCTEIISKTGNYPDWNTHAANLSKNQQIAEQFLDELIEGVLEVSYTKFTRRFEEIFLVSFPESTFLKEMRHVNDELGKYLGREFMGSLSGIKNPNDDRYPNHVRYIWRCFFENKEELIRVGIYIKDNTHYVSTAGSV